MDYLPPANRVALGESVVDQLTASGKDVVIIGGGDTGADCLGTALRQGARRSPSWRSCRDPPLERPRRQPWPTYPMIFRVASAHEEGGERLYAVSTRRSWRDEAGGVRALRLVEVELVEGRFTAVEGSEREIPAELVLLAMGFTGPERGPLLEQLGRRVRRARERARATTTFMSGVAGVFVAGDAGRGQSLIVWAIAEGRACAAAVDRWLTGSSVLPAPIPPTARPMTV